MMSQILQKTETCPEVTSDLVVAFSQIKDLFEEMSDKKDVDKAADSLKSVEISEPAPATVFTGGKAAGTNEPGRSRQ